MRVVISRYQPLGIRIVFVRSQILENFRLEVQADKLAHVESSLRKICLHGQPAHIALDLFRFLPVLQQHGAYSLPLLLREGDLEQPSLKVSKVSDHAFSERRVSPGRGPHRTGRDRSGLWPPA